MAQVLASKLGLGVGISSGANLVGATKVQNETGPSAVVVTVFPDDNKKYLSTGLLREEPVKSEYVTPDVELIGFEVFKRVCHTCCEMHECTQRLTSELPAGALPMQVGGIPDGVTSHTCRRGQAPALASRLRIASSNSRRSSERRSAVVRF